VDWYTEGLTAHHDEDYGWASGGGEILGTLSFGVNDDTAYQCLYVINDNVAEWDEQFKVVLCNAYGATLGDENTCVVNIVDDETRFEFDQDFVDCFESSASGNSAHFEVTGYNVGEETVHLNWITQGVSAHIGDDYGNSSGGECSGGLDFTDEANLQYIDIPIVDDNVPELDENFGVVVYDYQDGYGGPVFHPIIDAQAIIHDDQEGFFVDGTQYSETDGWILFNVKGTSPAGATSMCWIATGDAEATPFSGNSGSITYYPPTYTANSVIAIELTSEVLSFSYVTIHLTDGYGEPLPGNPTAIATKQQGDSVWTEARNLLTSYSTVGGDAVASCQGLGVKLNTASSVYQWYREAPNQPMQRADWSGCCMPPDSSESTYIYIARGLDVLNGNTGIPEKYWMAAYFVHEVTHADAGLDAEVAAYTRETQFVIDLYNAIGGNGYGDAGAVALYGVFQGWGWIDDQGAVRPSGINAQANSAYYTNPYLSEKLVDGVRPIEI